MRDDGAARNGRARRRRLRRNATSSATINDLSQPCNTTVAAGVLRVDTSGGAPQAVADAYCPEGLAADGNDVYFDDYFNLQGDGPYAEAMLYRAPSCG
jgi:hypothetical protein